MAGETADARKGRICSGGWLRVDFLSISCDRIENHTLGVQGFSLYSEAGEVCRQIIERGLCLAVTIEISSRLDYTSIIGGCLTVLAFQSLISHCLSLISHKVLLRS